MFNISVDDRQIKIDKSLSIRDFSKKYFNNNQIVAAKINGDLRDLSDNISEDCELSFITINQIEGLEILRHSCAHLLGHALKQIHPEVKMVIGPVIKNGFYYDILSEKPISENELPKIEKLMKKLSKKNYNIVREVVDRDKAIQVFKDRNEDYKLKLIDDIPESETIAIYHHEEYIDMCRGPHLVNTNLLKHFKLMKVSGSYWRGDSKNQSLQRIYGTAWDSDKSLDEHLKKLEEADKSAQDLQAKPNIHFAQGGGNITNLRQLTKAAVLCYTYDCKIYASLHFYDIKLIQ